jgi:hypothetical protein
MSANTNTSYDKIFISDTTISTSNLLGALTVAGGVGISNTTDAISITNGGTITTAGGAAIAKSLFVGGSVAMKGAINLSGTTSGIISILPQAAAGTFNLNLPTTPGNDGEVLISGGGGATPMRWGQGGITYISGLNMNIQGSTINTVTNPTFSGVSNFTNTTTSTSSTTGALTLSGGLGISNTTDATSSTNGGTLTIAGGAAIAKTLRVGGNIYSSSILYAASVSVSGVASLNNGSQYFPSSNNYQIVLSPYSATLSTAIQYYIGAYQSGAHWGQGINPNNGAGGDTFSLYCSSKNAIIQAWYNTGEAYIPGKLTVNAFQNNSDYRLKENIKFLDSNVLDIILKLKIYHYNLKDDTTIKQYGFLAHEVQKIIPDIVVGQKDAIGDDGKPKHQGIYSLSFIPLLAKSIQELSKTIETQKNEIQSQRDRIDKLETFISSKFPTELYMKS